MKLKDKKRYYFFKKDHMTNKCYANSLGDCKGPMSNEHYISECMLPDEIEFCGGVKFAGKKLSKKIVVAKILCQKHNSSLADFDAVGGLLLEALETITCDDKSKQEPKSFEINGDYIEKWLLKTSINHLHQNDKNYIEQASAHLEYLFKGKNFSWPHGLYSFKRAYSIGKSQKGFMLFPLLGINELYIGVLFFINSVPFVLFNRFYHGLPGVFMDHCPDWVDEKFKVRLFEFQKMLNDPNELEYRPLALDKYDQDSGQRVCSINFKWD